MKKNTGITIISLVVTIIILIILAGVSLNLTLGQNGIITKAKQAKENIELAKVEEETRLNELYNELEKEGDSSGISYDAIAKIKDLENKLSNLQNEFNNLQNEYNTFKTTIAEAITEMGVATAENADASTMSNNIRSISGASQVKVGTFTMPNSGSITIDCGFTPNYVFMYNNPSDKASMIRVYWNGSLLKLTTNYLGNIAGNNSSLTPLTNSFKYTLDGSGFYGTVYYIAALI